MEASYSTGLVAGLISQDGRFPTKDAPGASDTGSVVERYAAVDGTTNSRPCVVASSILWLTAERTLRDHLPSRALKKGFCEAVSEMEA